MKTLELNKLNVSELSKEELVEITGGSFWSVMGNIFGAIAAAGLVLLVVLGIEEATN